MKVGCYKNKMCLKLKWFKNSVLNNVIIDTCKTNVSPDTFSKNSSEDLVFYRSFKNISRWEEVFKHASVLCKQTVSLVTNKILPTKAQKEKQD